MLRGSVLQPVDPKPYVPAKAHFDRYCGFYALFVGIYIFLSPFYVFHSGLPQPADIILVLVMVPALSILFLNQKGKIDNPVLIGTLFVVLTFLINLIHFSFFPAPRFLFSSIYYFYNFSVFLFFAFMFRNYPRIMIKTAYVAIAAIILFQVPHIALFPDSTWRQTGTFNNPNQLAYWSLLSMLVIIAFRHNSKLTPLDFVLFFVLLYLQTQALSKAGMITFAAALCILPFLPQITKLGRMIMLMGVMAGIIYGIVNFDKVLALPDQIEEVGRVVARLESFGQDQDDDPAVRGYDRIFQFPEYLLFGAGEGAYERFRPEHPNEIHSGLATILFSYGFIGFFLFMTFLYALMNRLPWYYVALFGCVFLYSLPHQNIRFTHFWVYLGILDASRYFLMQQGTEGVQRFSKRRRELFSMQKFNQPHAEGQKIA